MVRRKYFFILGIALFYFLFFSQSFLFSDSLCYLDFEAPQTERKGQATLISKIRGITNCPDGTRIIADFLYRNIKIGLPLVLKVEGGTFESSKPLIYKPPQYLPASRDYKVRLSIDPLRQPDEALRKFYGKLKQPIVVVKNFSVGTEEDMKKDREAATDRLRKLVENVHSLYLELFEKVNTYKQILTKEEEEFLAKQGLLEKDRESKQDFEETEWKKWLKEWQRKMTEQAVQAVFEEGQQFVPMYPEIVSDIKTLVETALSQVRCYEGIIKGLSQFEVADICKGSLGGTGDISINKASLKSSFEGPYETILKKISQERVPEERDALFSDIRLIYEYSIGLIKGFYNLKLKRNELLEKLRSGENKEIGDSGKKENERENKNKEDIAKFKQSVDEWLTNWDEKLGKLSEEISTHRISFGSGEFKKAFENLPSVATVLKGIFKELGGYAKQLYSDKVFEPGYKFAEEEKVPKQIFVMRDDLVTKVKKIVMELGQEFLWLELKAKDAEIADLVPKLTFNDVEPVIAAKFYELEKINCTVRPLDCAVKKSELLNEFGETTFLYDFLKKTNFKLAESDNYEARTFALSLIQRFGDKKDIDNVSRLLEGAVAKADKARKEFEDFKDKERDFIGKCGKISIKLNTAEEDKKKYGLNLELTDEEKEFIEQRGMKEKCAEVEERLKALLAGMDDWNKTIVNILGMMPTMLRGLKGEEIIKYMEKYLKVEDFRIREVAVRVLTEVLPLENFDVLIDMLDDRVEQVRIAVAGAMEKMLGWLIARFPEVAKMIKEYPAHTPADISAGFASQARINQYYSQLEKYKQDLSIFWKKHKDKIIELHNKEDSKGDK